MNLLPDVERILLGPGPSLTAPRVRRAMAAPTISHLDPLMIALLDDVRARSAQGHRVHA
jgi:alanine-glyoxylate transaminase/serine-glyoxylate transaminase/serine-pyruvate transaminase